MELVVFRLPSVCHGRQTINFYHREEKGGIWGKLEGIESLFDKSRQAFYICLGDFSCVDI